MAEMNTPEQDEERGPEPEVPAQPEFRPEEPIPPPPAHAEEEVETFVEPPRRRFIRPLGKPMRLVFGDMAGVFFLVWVPIVFLFVFPAEQWFLRGTVLGDMTWPQLLTAVIIALPPFVVLTVHLAKGRLLDGILDMLLWAIWECGTMIVMCYLYPGTAERMLWQSGSYWSEMSAWVATGIGAEGDPGQWLSIHLKNIILLFVGALVFGLPALVMGVLQLNYMNYYVARCLLMSDNVLITLPIAWHFWSIIRVIGYIVIASTLYQLNLRALFRAPARTASIWGGLIIGIVLTVIDGLLKWQFADHVRLVLKVLCDL